MFLSADINKLRQHLDYIQNEISIIGRIIEELELQYLKKPVGFDAIDEFYQKQIHFAKNLEVSLVQRKKLVEDTIDILLQAKYRISNDVDNAISLIK